MRCSVGMDAGSSSGLGFFLQRAFKRQGFFYATADVGFGLRYLQGTLSGVDAQQSQLPLRELSFKLIAGVIRPYVQLGITPLKFPDLLISFGPNLQIASGDVSVNYQKKRTILGTSSGYTVGGLLSGFLGFEIVFLRFGGGAFSAFVNRDFTSGDAGTKLYPGTIDQMENFRANFYNNVGGSVAFGLGLKLLLNWP